MSEPQQVQVDITHVLSVTQARLQAATEQCIVLEALANQQGLEIQQLKEALNEMEASNGKQGKGKALRNTSQHPDGPQG